MPFLPVFLTTDVLLWLLVCVSAGYGWYCRRHAHLAAPWVRVFQTRTAVVSVVILTPYLLVGLADSLHFRTRLEQVGAGSAASYSPEVLSLLDIAASHLRSRREKTYSAPFATRLYAKEQIELADGRQVRDFPRLQYGGAHLRDEEERVVDMSRRAAAGLAAAAALWILLAWVVKPLRRRWAAVPWGAAWWTVGPLLVIAAPVLLLSEGYHVFGTDKVGQDVLYLSLKSIRTSLVIGTLTTLAMLPFGIGFGIVAGYFRGWVDDLIQYVYTTLNSIPGVLLIAAAVLMMQVYVDMRPELFPTAAERADFRLLMLCGILGVTTWTGLTRLLRGETLKLSELEYIQAAHAFGVSNARILTRHILPNVAHIVIITVALEFSALVLTEAVLSYIGVGVDPATTSFGTMINAARLEMSREPIVWWSIAAAFAFMLVLVLAANLFADTVRDGFDPRVRMVAIAA
ncbi:MAG: peptide ABC transporter permease [Betaproteobacteria bacterium RIFCSPLOWO2_12_FULL_68_20]|nr:MAG: peptide ABC transporter permease [Betaproteobacteria bacterium RIFCSPLOWO2_12_FULL_68_20]